jgi:hypothetical protein
MDQLCLDDGCIFRGVGCREAADCNEGDTCDGARCVPDGADCPPDALEADGEGDLEAGVYPGLSICPADIDGYAVRLEVGETLTVSVDFNAPNGQLRLVVDGEVAMQMGDRLMVSVVAERMGVHRVVVSGADEATRNGYALTVTVEAARLCMDTTLYPDADGDGYGVDGGAVEMCVDGAAAPDGFALQSGDCRADDVLAHPNALEVCGDWVDDDCNGADAECPESMPGMQVPEWNCAGDPPPSVYASARFPDGAGYFNDGGCFYVFEGLPNEFYVTRRLERSNQDASCDRINGCTCPSLNNWPAYDRRMYAYTLRGGVDDCDTLRLVDHGGEEQPVSNNCRKYLYQMHFYDMPHSYVGRGIEGVARRLRLFPTVEVACIQDFPHANLPYQTLLTAPIELNPNYAPLE